MSTGGIHCVREERRELRRISSCSHDISNVKELYKLLKKHSKKSFTRLKEIFKNGRMVAKINTLWDKVSETPYDESLFKLAKTYTLMYCKVIEAHRIDLDNKLDDHTIVLNWKLLFMGLVLRTCRKKYSNFECEVLARLNLGTVFSGILKLLQSFSFSYYAVTLFLRQYSVHHDLSQLGVVCLCAAAQRDGLEKSMFTIMGIELLKTLAVTCVSEWEWTMNITLDISYKTGSVMCTKYWKQTNSLIHCWLDKCYTGMQIDWTKWECFFNYWKFDDIYLRMCTFCRKRPSMTVFERLKLAALDEVNGKEKIESIAKWIPGYRVRCLWMGNHSLDQLLIDLILQTKSSSLFEALVSGSKFYCFFSDEILENKEEKDCSKILKKILFCYKECISQIQNHELLIKYDDDVLYDEEAFESQSRKILHTHYDMEKMPICPITNEVPIAPVTTFRNRYYEKHALLSWIQNSDGRDPLDPSTILSLKDVKDVNLKDFTFAKHNVSIR